MLIYNTHNTFKALQSALRKYEMRNELLKYISGEFLPLIFSIDICGPLGIDIIEYNSVFCTGPIIIIITIIIIIITIVLIANKCFPKRLPCSYSLQEGLSWCLKTVLKVIFNVIRSKFFEQLLQLLRFDTRFILCRTLSKRSSLTVAHEFE